MPRGRQSEVGSTNTAKNGYHYTRCPEGWRLTHHLVAEKALGRPIHPDETVKFKDGDRNNLDPSNIEVSPKRVSLRGRLATLKAKRMEIDAEIAIIEEKLAKQQQRDK